jgi:hypothetical protein
MWLLTCNTVTSLLNIGPGKEMERSRPVFNENDYNVLVKIRTGSSSFPLKWRGSFSVEHHVLRDDNCYLTTLPRGSIVLKLFRLFFF